MQLRQGQRSQPGYNLPSWVLLPTNTFWTPSASEMIPFEDGTLWSLMYEMVLSSGPTEAKDFHLNKTSSPPIPCHPPLVELTFPEAFPHPVLPPALAAAVLGLRAAIWWTLS